jgi:serine/threonine-protein kinase
MSPTTTCARCGADVSSTDERCRRCSAPTTPPPSSGGGAGVSAPRGRATDIVLERLQRATLGHYVIERELGRGGMASVYLAHEITLDRRVAIKVMSPQLLAGEGMIDRFRHEAMTVARLSHPHIVSIYAVREDEELHYFVMQYIEGTSLDQVVRTQGAMSIAAVQVVLCQVASALHYAHRRGIIHRDTKPANIMLDEDGNAIVTDFGIARVATGPRLTLVGGTIGTPEYMSPEQCDAMELTGASDQYSLGIVAYELLTGMPPFAGSALTVMMAHARDPVPALASLRPDCPPQLADVVSRMMEKDPERRWPDMGAIVDAIGMPVLHHDHPVRRELRALAALGSRDRPAIHVPESPPVRPSLRAGAVMSVRLEPSQITLPLGQPLQLRAIPLDANGTEVSAEAPSWSSSAPGVVAVSPDGVVIGMALGLAEISAHIAGCSGSSRIAIMPGTVQAPLPPVRGQVPGQAHEPVRKPVQERPHEREPVLEYEQVQEEVHEQREREDERVPVQPDERGSGAERASGRIAPAASLPSGTQRRTSRSRKRVAIGSAMAAGLALVAIIAVQSLTGGEDAAPIGEGAIESGQAEAPPDVEPSTTDPASGPAPVPIGADPRIDSVDAAEGPAPAGGGDAPAPTAAIRLTSPTQTIEVGDTLRLIASLSDDSAPSPGSLRWESRDVAIGTVSPAGVVSALAPGVLRILARQGAQSDTATITVVPPSIASLSVATASVALTVGERTTIQATASDRRGRTVVDPVIAWRSSDSSVAAVNPATGSITGRGPGSATITATGGGHVATASVVVASAAPVAGRGDVPAVEPETPPLPSVRAIHAGGAVTCASTDAGAVHCRGGLGGNAAMPALESGATQLALGATHGCALRGGRVACWGANNAGQLGDGSTRARSAPGPVSGDLRFTAITVGASHTCGLAENGRAHCWGANNSGQLGDGSTRARSVPSPVSGDLAFTALSAGREHTCGITTDGRAHCWGYGFAGALGHGFRQNETSPTAVDAGTRLTRIRAGANHTCALAATGRVLCWGENRVGELGDGSTRERFQPVEAGRLAFTDIGVGDAHTCGLASDGSIHCWGDNAQGQLGTGNRTRRPAPTAVATSQRFTALAVAARHACALATDGRVFCWGDDSRGQLGVEGTSATQPVEVPALVRRD